MSATDTAVQRTDAVSLNDEEAVKTVLVESVLGLWDVVNNLTRLRPSRKEHYRVTIFGSARAKPGTIAYEETKRVAKALAALGCDIITGGGPGLMQAANEGVDAASGSKSEAGYNALIAATCRAMPSLELQPGQWVWPPRSKITYLTSADARR